jgi:hypothetical protein
MINSRFSRAFSVRSMAMAGSLLFLAVLSRAQDTGVVRYKASPLGSKVRIEGDSTVHHWSMTGQIIGGFLEVPAPLDPAQAAQAGVVGGKLNARAEISIPVTSMQSGTEGMDEVMQEDMNAKEYRSIKFHLTEMVLKEPHAAGTPLEFSTTGNLMVAGVTNKITMPVRIENAEKPNLKVTGSVPLKMTDYKVKPPVKLGVFKTTNEITVSFEWVIVPPKAAAAK